MSPIRLSIRSLTLGFGMLASETRIRILLGLADGTPKHVKEISQIAGITGACTSVHLRNLESNGFLRRSRLGYYVEYVIVPEAFEVLLEAMADIRDGKPPGMIDYLEEEGAL